MINLVGKHFETMRWSFTDVHFNFPAVLAQVCADVGVERVHIDEKRDAYYFDASNASGADDLPGRWVLKGTHVSGYVALVENGTVVRCLKPVCYGNTSAQMCVHALANSLHYLKHHHCIFQQLKHYLF